MSVADEILRITTARNTIRDKLVSLGLGLSTYDIDACASAVDSIVSRGAVSVVLTSDLEAALAEI